MTKTEPAERKPYVHYNAETAQIVVSLVNDASFRVPVHVFPNVAEADDAVRGAVRFSRDGVGLRWDALDVDYYWPYLMGVLLGKRAWRRAANSAIGSITSPAKVRAARVNGAKGGRPRKKPPARA